MPQPAVVISVLALAFTLFSFWWMNWRPGKLVVTDPRSYAAISIENKIILEIPLVFFNHGATPIIVHNLRLRLDGVNQALAFNAVVEKLGDHSERQFASQFAVRPREAVSLICEFQSPAEGFTFECKDYRAILDWAEGSSREWKHLADFPIKVAQSDLMTINSVFIVHDNW
jgi:hypothetical protein